MCVKSLMMLKTFLSTPSVGRATRWAYRKAAIGYYFYPRPPWGGRLPKPAIPSAFLLISIHALRGEGDSSTDPATPPSRISIHALRGEGDGLSVTGLDWVN